MILTALWAALHGRRAHLYVPGFAVYPLDLGNHCHCHPHLLVRTGMDPHVAAFWPNLFVIVTGLIIAMGG